MSPTFASAFARSPVIPRRARGCAAAIGPAGCRRSWLLPPARRAALRMISLAFFLSLAFSGRGPVVEHLLLHHAHGDRHEGVVLAAQLGALAEIDAFLHGLEPGRRDAAGNGIDLGPERGNGPGMDHVAGGDEHVHHLVDRHQDLVVDGEVARHLLGRHAGLDGVLALLVLQHHRIDADALVGILVRPVPGMADGLDRQVGRRKGVLEVEELEGGDGDRHQHEHRQHRPQDLDRRVVRGARRDRVALLAEAPHDEEHAAPARRP